VRVLLIFLALALVGCAGPRQFNSTDALAAQKQKEHAERTKELARQNKQLREAVRQAYVNEHPTLNANVRKAILKENLTEGMSNWDVIAAYSLWQYTSDPRVAGYRESGVAPLWTLVKWQLATTQASQDEWILQRGKDTQFLFFEKGELVRWKH
jgi:hypothetical protein